MFREEDGEEESPGFDVFGVSLGAEAVVAEEVDEGAGGDASEPGEEVEGVQPGTYGIGALGRWSLHLDADLERICAELKPIVHNEGHSRKRPDHRKE